MLKDCSCGHICLDNSEQTCERYQNPLSCREYKSIRKQHRMKALANKGQRLILS
jgi:hypothetical protein